MFRHLTVAVALCCTRLCAADASAPAAPSASAPAAEAPASEASIREMMDLTNVRKMLDTTFSQIDQMSQNSIRQSLGGTSLTDEQKKKAETIHAKTMAIMREEFSWEVLEPMFIKIYQQSFSQQDIDGIIAFYKTPAGQSMIRKMPLVMKNTMAVMQERMGPLMQKLQKVATEEMAPSPAAKPTPAAQPAAAPAK